MADKMIRVMHPDDEPAVRELYKVCHPTWAEKPLGWFRPDHTTLVAEWSGEIIGYALLGFALGHAYLSDSAVHPEWRGKGIARQLHDARIERARKKNAELVIGWTWAENAPMVRLLTRLGFKHTETIKDFYTENDPPADGMVFVKWLRRKV